MATALGFSGLNYALFLSLDNAFESDDPSVLSFFYFGKYVLLPPVYERGGERASQMQRKTFPLYA